MNPLETLTRAEPSRMFRDLLQMLRDNEARYPFVARFDEATLPERASHETEYAWRRRQARVVFDHIQRVQRELESLSPTPKARVS